MFITLEGTEGVGKSSNLAFIQNWLINRGKQLVVTREPGGTPFAEEIRQLLLAPRQEQVSDDAELLLMFAARAQHVAQKIRPALQNGFVVLSDRFVDASYAYQGGGRGISMQRLDALSQWTLQGFLPDLTFLLDMAPADALERAKKRGDLDRFEQEQQAFFERVRNVYLQRAKADPKRIMVINAAQTLEQVQQDIAHVLEQRVPK
ncbi:dTMP kinase [Permianibacter aggregans]|uniref:Thymidylate kinase n=1 Tax=Permianibacter aggregans TaxID=1510150 RepID=A0A4R6UZ32_9GAMM|nr:dTMP kinase [Permianibacter aggregans]QGX41471.1 dTMP kinase [Permianibacter aggregans]TDQ51263.1 thymidylate kinase [Permianibacter aggregans]